MQELPQAETAAIYPRAVLDRLGLLLTKLGDEIFTRAEPRLMSEAGLSGRHYYGLAVLEGDRPASQQELARMVGKVPAFVVALIDELEEAGHVERSRDPDDRRRTRVTLTRSGRTALRRGDAVARAIEQEVLGDRGDDVLRALNEALG